MGALDGRVAPVTGSSRGIGAAIAERFAREGARVAVHGRDEGALEAVRARIAGGGAEATAVAADLTSAAGVDARGTRRRRARPDRRARGERRRQPGAPGTGGGPDNHPVRRLGAPDDVADAAVFLASDQSAWITGIVLDVTGGGVMVWGRTRPPCN